MPIGTEERGSAVVIIGGQAFNHFLSLNLRRSKNELACNGTIVLSWPGAEQFNVTGLAAKQIIDGAEGVIMLDGQHAASIRIDKRISKGTPKSYELTIQFRDINSNLIDAMPISDTGQYNNMPGPELLRKLMEGYGANMNVMSAMTKNIKRFIVQQGETVERAMRRAARDELGANFFSDHNGVIQLFDKASVGGTGQHLILGRDFTEWSVKRDMSMRYETYDLDAHGLDTDQKYGKDNHSITANMNAVMAMGSAGGVGFAKRFMGIVDGDHDKGSAQQRLGKEQGSRSGQGLNVTLRMPTWGDGTGRLWTVMDAHHITIPIDEVDQSLRLDEVEFELARDTRRATLTFTDEGAWGGGIGASNFNDGVKSSHEVDREVEAQGRQPAVVPIGKVQTPAQTPPAPDQPPRPRGT